VLLQTCSDRSCAYQQNILHCAEKKKPCYTNDLLAAAAAACCAALPRTLGALKPQQLCNYVIACILATMAGLSAALTAGARLQAVRALLSALLSIR
jgi:hypothetical protein